MQTDMARFVSIDRDTPMLLPPDLRDWVPPGHLVHFLIDAIVSIDTASAQINHRGTGHEQYPPAMLLALLVYSYCSGTFSSPQIEASTHSDVAVRFLCANTHPERAPIFVFTQTTETVRHQALNWNSHAFQLDFTTEAEETFNEAEKILIKRKLVSTGDKLIVLRELIEGEERFESIQIRTVP
jgi:hypothetical protein